MATASVPLQQSWQNMCLHGSAASLSEFGVIAAATEEEELKWFRREQVFCDGGSRRSQSQLQKKCFRLVQVGFLASITVLVRGFCCTTLSGFSTVTKVSSNSHCVQSVISQCIVCLVPLGKMPSVAGLLISKQLSVKMEGE